MITKKHRLIISLYALAANIVNVINVALMMTASHYTLDPLLGIFINTRLIYDMYPIVQFVDIFFGILYIAIPFVLTVSCRLMKKDDDRGIYISIFCNIAILFCCIFYPFSIVAITGMITPFFALCIIQTVGFAIIAVLTSVYFLKASYIIQ